MDNNTPFSPASEKGRFNGLVYDGKSLFIYNAVFSASNSEIRFTLHDIRIMLAFRAELVENTKPAKNLCDLCGQKSVQSVVKNL